MTALISPFKCCNVIHHLAAIMACPPLFPLRRDLLTQLHHDNTLNSIGRYVATFI